MKVMNVYVLRNNQYVFEMQMFQKTEKYDKDFISEFRLPNQ